MFLTFNTKELADTANDRINENKQYTGNLTSNWAISQETIENKWSIPKPDNVYMQGVSGYTESESVEFKILTL